VIENTQKCDRQCGKVVSAAPREMKMQRTELVRSDRKVLEAIFDKVREGEGNPCQSDLKRRTGLSYNTVRICVERLHGKGFVEMRNVRGAKEVGLTGTGMDWMTRERGKGPIDRFVARDNASAGNSVEVDH